MAINLQQFAAAAGCTPARAEVWHGPMVAAMALCAINTPVRRAAFLGQVGHESKGLSRLTENLNYSAQRILEVWPKRFPGGVAQATRYAHAPERLANLVYGSRLGNRGEASGDGWAYRGRGPLGITGLDNYLRCGADIGRPIAEQPDLVADDPHTGALVATWVWTSHGCNACAFDCDQVSDRINLGRPTPKVGDAVGYADRKARFEHALKALA